MAEFKCKWCDKVFWGKNPSHNYDCCSRSCAAKYRSKIRASFGYDPELDWKREGDRWVCPYHENVACRARQCASCGWNPAVERRRNLNLGVTV